MEKEKIKVVKANIVKMNVDAIVNAANSSLLGGGGVDGAIHKAAGPKLLDECKQLGGCATGKAKITRAYQLPAKYVIHTVGPVWRGGTQNEAQLLAACYDNSMQLAHENNAKTIAFPAISCGIYGYPIDQAAGIAVKTVTHFLETNDTIDEVFFVCFDEPVYSAYMDALNSQK